MSYDVKGMETMVDIGGPSADFMSMVVMGADMMTSTCILYASPIKNQRSL